MSLPLVAIVGRPNVGKSSLFNRLVGQRMAITESVSGVTRDRIYAQADWAGRDFLLIDTGGIVPASEEIFERSIRRQAEIAISEASVILFVVDVTAGVHPLDAEVALMLHRSGKKVMLIANKVDNAERDTFRSEFYSLGLGEPYASSAMNGRGVGDFLDELLKLLPPPEPESESSVMKLAIVGKPNVGKSSYLNALLGEERAIVTDIAGTTRDSIHSQYTYYGQPITLIDTAGIRRKKYIDDALELYSIVRTMKAIEECDVAVILIDATQGVTKQDARILNDVVEARKGAILVVNKWDVIEKETNTAAKFEKEIKDMLVTLDYVPTIFISALTHQRHTKPIDLALKIFDERKKRITTGNLNEYLLPEIEKTPPPGVQGRDLRINFITQVRAEPPVFAFFSNFPDLIPDSYKRFLERKLREQYGFEGVPISMIFRRK
ncbi:MAG TPA: ribosome biogenesis GTPase Der [Candidatus Kapabacteria bacterium]|nr:ribosome biogenesis GTPase Der [Candidatus Kapabacteria bacterium]